MYQFNPYAIPHLIGSIYVLCLGLFIFLVRKKLLNFLFALAYWFASIWLFGIFMLYLTRQPVSLFWPKFVYAGVVFIAPSFYNFTVVLLNLKGKGKSILLAYLSGSFFLIMALFTDNFIVGLKKHYWGYHLLVNRPFHAIFLIAFFIIYATGLKYLFKEYRKIKSSPQLPLEFTRIKYVSISYVIALLGAFDYIPDWGFEFYPFCGYIFVSLALSLLTYSIVKHRLLDVTIVITRTSIFVAVYTLVIGIPFAISVWLKDWLIGIFGVNWGVLPLGLMVILATAGPFIYIYLERNAEKRLLYEQHRYQETLKQAAREIARIHNLKRLLNLIVHIVNKTVRISHSAIYLFNEKLEEFSLKAGRGLSKKQPISISKENSLISWLEEEKEPLLCEEIKRKAKEDPNSIFKELEEQMCFLNATLIIPGFLENKLLGLLIMGNKLSGKMYTSGDLNSFSVLASQSALAIENALLYENMEEQVRQRTKELVEVQKQLIQAEKLATVGILAGGVAHEINNPLTAILTNVQMLLVSQPVDDKLDRESLELIEEATKRCRTIVQKLMTYAKKPLETAEISEVNLLEVLKNVTSFLGYQLEQDGIKIIIDGKEDNYSVMGSQNELEQVATNIILNARDAIKQVKNSGDIRISLTKNSKWIKMTFKDEGLGIPREILPKIFDPFFTTKEVGKGTGLGLSICQSIVEKHHGLITVQSEPGKGSVFTVQLPKASAEIKSEKDPTEKDPLEI